MSQYKAMCSYCCCPGEVGTISGWGLQYTEPGGQGSQPGVLQVGSHLEHGNITSIIIFCKVANVTILANEECKEMMAERNVTWWGEDRFINILYIYIDK